MFEEYGLFFLMGRLPEHSVKRGGRFLTKNLKKKFFFFNFIAIELLYNVVLISESIIYIYTYPLFLEFPSHLGHCRTLRSVI